MSDLIAALQILLKYGDPQWPTICEHDELRIADIDPAAVSAEDIAELARLGFEVDEGEDGYFYSFRFGSA